MSALRTRAQTPTATRFRSGPASWLITLANGAERVCSARTRDADNNAYVNLFRVPARHHSCSAEPRRTQAYWWSFSMVDERYDAVREVLEGPTDTDSATASSVGVPNGTRQRNDNAFRLLSVATTA
jgi:hypothetical protein